MAVLGGQLSRYRINHLKYTMIMNYTKKHAAADLLDGLQFQFNYEGITYTIKGTANRWYILWEYKGEKNKYGPCMDEYVLRQLNYDTVTVIGQSPQIINNYELY